MYIFQVLTLQILMKLLKQEFETSGSTFPNYLFEKIVEKFTTMTTSSSSCVENLVSQVNEYADLRFHFFKNLGTLSKSQLHAQTAVQLNLLSTYEILMQIQPFSDDPEEWSPTYFCEGGTPQVSDIKACRAAFSECWLNFLRLPLPVEVFKKALSVVHSKLIPHLTQPTMLADFLTDSYAKGGVISLLALNGLFILINQHNLDYPDFYKKLYALLDRNVLHVKYRSRFFRMLEIFMSSTHIPVYMIAAFVKRMARLALTAPPVAIVVILPFIYNLLKAHPQCIRMIHRVDESCTECTDPYDFNEENPENCNALNSSLWEIQTMKEHYLPAVSTLARIFDEPLEKPPHDLDSYLDQTYSQIYQMERSYKVAPLAPSYTRHPLVPSSEWDF
ncbi:hypothetical protein HK102_010954 [Quaeritorhiza haematococci]|nr:hypothetical protein HK102_010954 [Quaeritorhiza haematococci]